MALETEISQLATAAYAGVTRETRDGPRRHLYAAALRLLRQAVQHLLQEAPVGQPGQPVAQRLVAPVPAEERGRSGRRRRVRPRLGQAFGAPSNCAALAFHIRKPDAG
jgi:hypothetical protein